MNSPHGPLRIGIGGPVGAGKTTLTAALCEAFRDDLSMAVVTNDIYTREDADALLRVQALPSDRIKGVETGGCPHTAIREDASINLAAIAELCDVHPDLDLVLIESGGDNLSATFFTRTRRPDDLCHRCCGGRGNTAQGRTSDHPLRHSGHQQDGPGSSRGCGSGAHEARH